MILAYDRLHSSPIQTAHRGLSGKAEAPPSASSPVSASSANATSRKQGDAEEDEKEGEGEERENEEEEEEDNDEEDQPSSPDSASSMEWRCRECKTRYTDRDDYIDHMKKEHGTVNTHPALLYCILFVNPFNSFITFSVSSTLSKYMNDLRTYYQRITVCSHKSEIYM